jgi:multisubunit Na+/H+ antiporter MnhB subunit
LPLQELFSFLLGIASAIGTVFLGTLQTVTSSGTIEGSDLVNNPLSKLVAVGLSGFGAYLFFQCWESQLQQDCFLIIFGERYS